MTGKCVAALLVLAGTPSLAHRLDEYLQGTIISIDANRLEAQMTLTPGVAVFPFLISYLDADRNGAISEEEQRAYARRVLNDLSLTIDGRQLTPELRSLRFPAVEEMKEGRGEIQIEFSAPLPGGGPERRLTLDNHHLSRISAYQVNSLVARDPHVRISAQKRNYSQSHYELVYSQTDVRSAGPVLHWWSSGELAGLAALAILLLTRLVLMRSPTRLAALKSSFHVSTIAK
jgi:hypothetical protein